MILKHSMEVPVESIKKTGFSKMKARFIFTAQEGVPDMLCG